MKPKPVQSYCRLCERLFCYFQKTKARKYCPSCVEVERHLNNFFLRERYAVLKAEKVA